MLAGRFFSGIGTGGATVVVPLVAPSIKPILLLTQLIFISI